MKYRFSVLQKADRDPDFREAVKAYTSQDRLFFFNVFLYTYDPRRPKIKTIPFITYFYQDDIILWDALVSKQNKDSLVEKSRDMGATWMFVGNDLFDFLFSKEKIEIRWGSRKEDYVDKRGDMDSIFEKFRFAARLLPLWMLPAGWDWNSCDNHMRLINPETGSSITGESTNDHFGRGGRKFRIRFDEFAFWECADGAWQAAADATACRTALSTPNGSSNKFAKLAASEIEKRQIHWTMHPEKNPGAYILDVHGDNITIHNPDNPYAAFNAWKEWRLKPPPPNTMGGWVRSKWYDDQCARRNNAKEIAEELDIDYTRSGHPFFDLSMLAKQPVHTLLVSGVPMAPIPSGRYIQGDIVESGDSFVFRESSNGFLRVFEYPKRSGQYVVGGDTSEGLAKGDEGFLVVRDKFTGDVVAAGNGAWDPDMVEIYAWKTGRFYNNAVVAVENNNHGFSVNNGLKNRDCRLYYTRKTNGKGSTAIIKAGWSTTSSTRPLMLDQAKEDIRKISCWVRDPVILAQMGTFIFNDNGKAEAAGDFLDDGVLAFSIAGQVLREMPYKPPKARTTPPRTEGRKNGQFAFGKR